jgi:hypothetical protein
VKQNHRRFRRIARFEITNFRAENRHRFILRRGLRESRKAKNKHEN